MRPSYLKWILFETHGKSRQVKRQVWSKPRPKGNSRIQTAEWTKPSDVQHLRREKSSSRKKGVFPVNRPFRLQWKKTLQEPQRKKNNKAETKRIAPMSAVRVLPTWCVLILHPNTKENTWFSAAIFPPFPNISTICMQKISSSPVELQRNIHWR